MSQNDLLFFGLIGFMILLASPAIVLALKSMAKSDRLIARLESHSLNNPSPTHTRKKPVRTKSLGDVFIEVGKRASPGNAEQLSAIRFKLLRAGFLSQKAVAVYFSIRLMTVVIPQLVLLFFISDLAEAHKFGPLFASIILVLLGLLAPDKFPDMMDLMVSCIEAGMSVDAAVSRVAEELVKRFPNLAMHLNIIALELRAGRSREDAWKNFAQRLGIDAADSLATMLRQAEEMGSSVGTTLRVFSQDMRQRRMLAAEEQALALSAKLSLPLILFVFPTLLGVLLLPVIVQVMEMGG